MSETSPLQRVQEPLHRSGHWVAGTMARIGWAGMTCFGLVLVMGAMAGWRVGQDRPASWPAGWILPLVGVMWVSATAAASALPVLGFACAGLLLAWHGLSLMAPWTGTPLVAAPVLWLLAVSLALLAWKGPRHQWAALAIWLVIACGAGWSLAEITGWNRLLGLSGGAQRGIGQAILAGALAWGGIRLRPVLRRLEWTEPSFGRVWMGGLAVMTPGLLASAWRDLAAAEGWAWGAVETSAPWAALTWFWLGGTFAVCLVKGAAWTTGLVVRGRASNAARWLLPAIWLGTTLLEWLATHSSGQGWGEAMPQAAVQWIQTWPERWRMAVEAHAWAGVVVVVLGLGFLWQGRDSVRLLHRLNALWMAALVGLVGVGDTLPQPAGAAVPPVDSPWGAGLLLLVGLPAILAGLWAGRSWEGIELWRYRIGAVVFFIGILLAVEFQSAVPWPTRAGPAALLGMVHLAFLQLLYEWWTGGQKLEGQLTLGTKAWLIFAGLACVIPLLHRDPQNIALLAYCPVLWLTMLLCLKRCQPSLNAASGALAGALLGSATAAAWSRPVLLLPEVPLVDWFNPPLAVFAGADQMSPRPFMDPWHFTLLFGLSAAGAALGALTFRPKSGPAAPPLPLPVAPLPDNLPPEGSMP